MVDEPLVDDAGKPRGGMDRLVSVMDSPAPTTRVTSVQRSATTIKQRLLDWCRAMMKGYEVTD